MDGLFNNVMHGADSQQWGFPMLWEPWKYIEFFCKMAGIMSLNVTQLKDLSK